MPSLLFSDRRSGQYYEHVAALIPGALNDQTNLAIVSTKIEQDGIRVISWFDVRHLQIWPADESYADIGNEIRGRLSTQRLTKTTTFVLDASELSRDSQVGFLNSGVRFMPVRVTDTDRSQDKPLPYSKTALIGTIVRLVDEERIRVIVQPDDPQGTADILKRELGSLRIKPLPGQDPIGRGVEQPQDGLLITVGLACRVALQRIESEAAEFRRDTLHQQRGHQAHQGNVRSRTGV